MSIDLVYTLKEIKNKEKKKNKKKFLKKNKFMW